MHCEDSRYWTMPSFRSIPNPAVTDYRKMEARFTPNRPRLARSGAGWYRVRGGWCENGRRPTRSPGRFQVLRLRVAGVADV